MLEETEFQKDVSEAEGNYTKYQNQSGERLYQELRLQNKWLEPYYSIHKFKMILF